MSEKPATPEPTPEHKFREALKKIAAVPKTEILRREAKYKEQQLAKKQGRVE